MKPVYFDKNLKIDKEIDTIVIGASHSACAFDDKNIDNLIIVAKSGEPVFFTSYKLKKILDQNANIKKVIWTFSESSISKTQDRRVVLGEKGTRDLFFMYFSLLDENGKSYLKRLSGDFLIANIKYSFGVPLSYMRDWKLYAKYYFKKIDYFDFDFSGGSECNHEGFYLDDSRIKKTIKRQFYYGPNQFKFKCSDIAIDHIYKILQLCKKRQIKLFIYKTPHHKKYIEKIPKYYKDEYDHLISQIKLKHPEIHYTDNRDLTFPDNHYQDGDHLNKIGKAYYFKFYKDIL
jgi:ribosomal protein L24E